MRRLQERYAVRIHFPKREDEEDRNSLPEEERPRGLDEIVVRGPSKGVKSAIEELNALLEYRIQLLEDRQQRSHTAEIEILARGRQRLLRNSNGIVPLLRHDPGHVRIDVPSRVEGESDDTMIKIRVEGTQAFVKRAIKEIGSLRDEVNGETTRTLTIDQRLHKSLIGPGGRALQKLIIDAGGPEDRSIQARMVKFPRQGDESDKIVLTGPPAVVDKIVEKFLEFAARETIEVDVPTDKLSRIIGTGGKKRMELEAEYDVIIYVPPVNRGAARGIEKVKVTGRPEQNERAKKAIYVRPVLELTDCRILSRPEMASRCRFQRDYIIVCQTTVEQKITFVNGSRSMFLMMVLKFPQPQVYLLTVHLDASMMKKKCFHGMLLKIHPIPTKRSPGNCVAQAMSTFKKQKSISTI